MFKADLHIHSVYSDGTDSPQDILLAAKNLGLSAVSITDHDTVAAFDADLFAFAEKNGVMLMPGVEISSGYHGKSVHLLAYNFRFTLNFLNFLSDIQKSRRERVRIILDKLKNYKINIEENELYKRFPKSVLGRVHIALLMREKNYVSSYRQAFYQYLKDGALCYVPWEKYSPVEVIDIVHEASGKVVLAHPHVIKNRKILSDLLQMPFDGIEGYYGKFQYYYEKKWVDIAKQKGWILTGGSDYHGKNRSFLSLGCSWSPENEFLKFGRIKSC